MVDFDLSPQQQAIRAGVHAFATTHLKDARKTYEAAVKKPNAEWSDGFRSTQSIYAEAVKAGLIKAQIPERLGGTGGALIDAAIVVEEMYAVETSASSTILGTGLGLSPLLIGGSEEMQRRLLVPFLSGEGSPMASLVFPEPAGSANYAEVGSAGLCTVAVDKGDHFVISGEKIWATNHGGWNDRGADLLCICCRVEDAGPDMRSQTAIIVVTREDVASNDPSAFQLLAHPQPVGHTAVNGPHIRYNKLRVPKNNVLHQAKARMSSKQPPPALRR
ncbi:hypothetical protein BAUCODRAFT_39353 [Baudoinia panamericana UAMH 10762]|uniref:Acyl-CoA dehydrogenase/oxidase N-terminal domain-containing protein n=1 Tax=Baudoinia panamericana (strain UAMH 10762) TaxID=717646 RepID=M2MIV0_BAUPA|nr:uncharacterized protein BAUCODRAFT_39353 [Baudoinia panamericana UAMH 10762]EMC91198.1 hypothetical protein BAUCODRAFT_39353 [Baudoinia panamericana UAMH 10762]